MKKLLFILNPTAGTRKAGKVLPQILSVFNRAGYDVITYVTDHPGDGKEFVKNRCSEMDLVVCCGGDGTFNETLSGISPPALPTILQALWVLPPIPFSPPKILWRVRPSPTM